MVPVTAFDQPLYALAKVIGKKFMGKQACFNA
jgi:hypothetical protein